MEMARQYEVEKFVAVGVEQLESSPVTLADQLTALFLQIKAFNAQTSIPLQLQISAADSLTTQGRNEQVAFLDSLMFTIEAKSVEIGEKLDELEPQILDLQRQKQEIAVESARLVHDRDVVCV